MKLDTESVNSNKKTDRDQHIFELTNELVKKSALLEQVEANAAEAKKRAVLELHELQAKLDNSVLSRNHALEHAQTTLQMASRATEANERSQREFAEKRADLEAKNSDLGAVRLQLADAESKKEKEVARLEHERLELERQLEANAEKAKKRLRELEVKARRVAFVS